MSNVGKAARSGVRFVADNSQRITGVFTAVLGFIQDHPEVPAWFRARVEDAQARVVEALRKRDPAARVRGVLDVVRHEAGQMGPGVDPEPWTRRADAIERDVRLAKLLPPSEQREALARLQAEAQGLVSDLLLEAARTRSGSAPEAPAAG